MISMIPKHKAGWAVVKGLLTQAPEIVHSSFTLDGSILNQLEAHSLREKEAGGRDE